MVVDCGGVTSLRIHRVSLWNCHWYTMGNLRASGGLACEKTIVGGFDVITTSTSTRIHSVLWFNEFGHIVYQHVTPMHMNQYLGPLRTILSMRRCWQTTILKPMLLTLTTCMRPCHSKLPKSLVDHFDVPTYCTHECEIMCPHTIHPCIATCPYYILNKLVRACVISSRYTCAHEVISHAISYRPFNTPPFVANHIENKQRRLREAPCASAIPKIWKVI